jgi:hypothetical protein
MSIFAKKPRKLNKFKKYQSRKSIPISIVEANGAPW